MPLDELELDARQARCSTRTTASLPASANASPISSPTSVSPAEMAATRANLLALAPRAPPGRLSGA